MPWHSRSGGWGNGAEVRRGAAGAVWLASDAACLGCLGRLGFRKAPRCPPLRPVDVENRMGGQRLEWTGGGGGDITPSTNSTSVGSGAGLAVRRGVEAEGACGAPGVRLSGGCSWRRMLSLLLSSRCTRASRLSSCGPGAVRGVPPSLVSARLAAGEWAAGGGDHCRGSRAVPPTVSAAAAPAPASASRGDSGCCCCFHQNSSPCIRAARSRSRRSRLVGGA